MGPDAVLYPGAYLDPLQLLANHPAYKPRPRPDVPLAPTAPIFSFSTSPAAPTHPLPSPGEFLLPPSPRFPFKAPAPDVSLKAAVNPIAEILRSLEPSTALFAPLAGAGSPSGPGQSHGQRFTTGMDSADLYPTKLEGLKASSAPTPADAWSSLLVRSRPRQTTAPDTACGLTGSTATSPFLGAADPIQPDAQPAAPAAAPDLKLAASSWSREPLRSPSYTLTSLLRQHGRGTLPKRSPPVVDFTAGFGLSAGTTPDPAAATPAQSQPIQDDAGLDLNPTKTSPPDVDLSARFASSFLRQAYQSCAEAEAATQTEAEAHSKAPAARDADVPRPSEDQSLREAMQHKTAAPADDQEPWRQVLGLVHGLAEDMKRMASDHCEPAAAPAAEEGRRRGPPEAAAVDVADPWDDPSELRRPGTPGTDSASSGGSVYEDPLADTPRAPRMLLRRDVELYSNEHFHPESADDDRDSCSSEDSPAMHAASGHSQQSVVIAGLAEIDGLLSSLDSASELPLLPLLPLDLGPVRGADDGGEADCRPPGPAATAGAPTERDRGQRGGRPASVRVPALDCRQRRCSGVRVQRVERHRGHRGPAPGPTPVRVDGPGGQRCLCC
ncbi:hypothetical protein ONE63_007133 [Megalurothrips usitatus]|uniref:Uncharacterized protein n=1 Tax=Megalurothrips usitatus TaxID=439358 RepID=A0AAV7XUH9_9NEOP|nr:hypothetical protein ONE63_007133 [Megalurothrips usitatus]